jgi:seryl-tRNA synthetase
MLDITLFRQEKGGEPEKIRESQRRRYAKVELVDEVIELDKEWRQREYSVTDVLFCLSALRYIYWDNYE